MKYSLRSLMIVAMLGPPLLAGGWFILAPPSSYTFSGSPAFLVAIVLAVAAAGVFISLRMAFRP